VQSHEYFCLAHFLFRRDEYLLYIRYKILVSGGSGTEGKMKEITWWADIHQWMTFASSDGYAVTIVKKEFVSDNNWLNLFCCNFT
jgi:hypothetical protein